ncbi:hypothetical protein [Okeania sp. SIO1I7]|nr:hypothetical protein [Okeania sp. SIO1I7]
MSEGRSQESVLSPQESVGKPSLGRRTGEKKKEDEEQEESFLSCY